eukprot:8563003-Alexandrium_andersonii.AAC.1
MRPLDPISVSADWTSNKKRGMSPSSGIERPKTPSARVYSPRSAPPSHHKPPGPGQAWAATSRRRTWGA